ncbi:MAG TPA: adenosylcobalamin-dependent ribonucleoside-diphosphate reductase [Syntrophomonadaceae bacterium]|jgi:ribonucleoside-diphosphate reductase alpha chain|nr:adenosylcobalamin-dependent ribonucleoside-diphosphate reductase [Syntrophomonadaceae bacterium]
MNLTNDGLTIFQARYALRDDLGQVIETPEQAVYRISRAAASAEKDRQEYWACEFSRLISELWFVPSTPIWANMGKPGSMQQPAACFVLRIEDNLQSMYQTLLESAMIAKYGGGLGYNFSEIRPKGDIIRSTKGRASGPVELIRLYNCSAAMIAQGGIRRGAYMGILDCTHPDIIEFIECKLQGELDNFNLSVGITDQFMHTLAKDGDWTLSFGGEARRIIPARLLWEKIVDSAWACGEPGLIFLDHIQAGNPIPGQVINATNPCGEQPLSPGESCLLGSINLARMMNESQSDIHWERLAYTAQTAVRFLDDLVDVGEYPFSFIKERSMATRKIGVGIMGLHDLLIKLGLRYDSLEGRRHSARLMAFIAEQVEYATSELGREKGNFPLWERSSFSASKQPRRNASCLTIAPTGTISILAGVEGYGIEPIFAVAYRRTYLQEGQPHRLNVFSPLFLAACKKQGVEAAVLHEAANRGTCQEVEGIPASIQRLFKGAREIDAYDHLGMQVALQKWVDNAISKTINLPASTPASTISDLYQRAWKEGLKGITVFREGSRAGIIEIGG